MEGIEDEPFVLWLNGDHVFPISNDDLPNGNLVRQSHGFPQDTKTFLSHWAVRRYVIRSVEVDGIDLTSIHELNEINGFGGFEPDLLQIGLIDNDVAIFFEFVAL